jgi:methyl-accepting chemotaxis protein
MSLTHILRRSFSRPALLGLVPIVIAVVGSGYITYRYNLFLTRTRLLVDHSLKVTDAIDDLMLTLQNAETGQRGYIITGKDAYLEPYRTATDGLAGELADLRKLIGDNADQIASLQHVEALSQSKLEELGTTIAVRRNEGFEAARAIVVGDEGKDTMDRIRAEVGAMRERESSLLMARDNSLRNTEHRVVLIVAISVLLGVTGRALSLVMPVLWRRSRARARAKGRRARHG